MKRKLSLLLAMVLAMTMVMMMNIATFATPSGTGTEGDPYRISSLTDGDNLPIPGSGTEFFFENDTTKAMFFFVDEDEHVTKACFSYKNEPIGDCGSMLMCLSTGVTMGIPIAYVDGSGIAVIKVKMEEDPIVPIPTVLNGAHTHNFQWQTITEPTQYSDGLEGEVCSCGATRNTQPISAFGYTINDYATKMVNASKSGQVIKLELGEWNSFPKAFMEKVAAKSAQNVTFVFKYKWNHVKQEITIPAGTLVDTSLDWYGPAKMQELYGAN